MEKILTACSRPSVLSRSEAVRPAWSEIDLSALAHNVATIRRMVEPGVRFYAVCKNNAYGCGARETSRTMLDAGADAFAVSDPDDVMRIREAGIDVPILLYACTVPDQAATMANMNVIVTVHDLDGLKALASTGVRCKVHVEVDCGYGRLGFTPEQWSAAFDRLKRATTLQVVGLYTHLASVDDSTAVGRQEELFIAASSAARNAGFERLELMAASSRVLLGYAHLNLSAVNPGRMLYGMLDEPWLGKTDVRPVIRAIKSKVLQVKSIPASFPLAAARGPATGSLRTAVISFGFKDGLPRQPAGGVVLVRGQRAPILGARSTEHTVIDVSHVPGVTPGDEVVIVGRQGNEAIDAAEAVGTYRMDMIELLPRMTLSTPRVYVTDDGTPQR